MPYIGFHPAITNKFVFISSLKKKEFQEAKVIGINIFPGQGDNKESVKAR
jgi:hypothetical protein